MAIPHRNDPRVEISPHADAIADMVRAPSPSSNPIAAGEETRPARAGLPSSGRASKFSPP